MTELLPSIEGVWPILPAMLRKFDRYARQDRFTGQTAAAFERWRGSTKELLYTSLGWCKMELCSPDAVCMGITMLDGEIRREHWRIQVEPEIWMTLFLLVPPVPERSAPVFLCPPGHNGAGKYAVAGVREYAAVAEKIDQYHYDYGLQLARLGCVAVCPDCRGFGERREDLRDTLRLPEGLKGDCYRLAHMGEPLGIPVLGMLTWDLARLMDWLEAEGRFDLSRLGCLGFSGGGMQTLWIAALDERIRLAVISGYLYGYRDALLTLNSNCSCNYVPHLWEHLDMGDIASLIAPRPLWVQSCKADRLNGPRGIVNVREQVAVARAAYTLLGRPERLIHEVCEGPHQWHGEHLSENLQFLWQCME